MYTLFYKEILHFWGKNDNKGVKQVKGSGKKKLKIKRFVLKN